MDCDTTRKPTVAIDPTMHLRLQYRCIRTLLEKVLERLATTEKSTIVIERQPDGKMRVTCSNYAASRRVYTSPATRAGTLNGTRRSRRTIRTDPATNALMTEDVIDYPPPAVIDHAPPVIDNGERKLHWSALPTWCERPTFAQRARVLWRRQVRQRTRNLRVCRELMFQERAHMPTFLFKCPSSGYRVQGFVAQEDETTDHDVFVPVNCPVCAQVHLVDPKPGRCSALTTLRRAA